MNFDDVQISSNFPTCNKRGQSPDYVLCPILPASKIISHVTKIYVLSRRTFQPFIIEWTISAVDSA